MDIHSNIIENSQNANEKYNSSKTLWQDTLIWNDLVSMNKWWEKTVLLHLQPLYYKLKHNKKTYYCDKLCIVT